MVNVGKYTSPMDPTGIELQLTSATANLQGLSMNIAPRPWDNRSILRRPLRKILVLPFVTVFGCLICDLKSGVKTWPPFWDINPGHEWKKLVVWILLDFLLRNSLFKGPLVFVGGCYVPSVPWKFHGLEDGIFLLNWSFCRAHVDVCRGVNCLYFVPFLKKYHRGVIYSSQCGWRKSHHTDFCCGSG